MPESHRSDPRLCLDITQVPYLYIVAESLGIERAAFLLTASTFRFLTKRPRMGRGAQRLMIQPTCCEPRKAREGAQSAAALCKKWAKRFAESNQECSLQRSADGRTRLEVLCILASSSRRHDVCWRQAWLFSFPISSVSLSTGTNAFTLDF